jgi:hypothetical protein
MLGAWTDVEPPQQTPLTAHIAIDITGTTQAEKEFVWTKPFGVVWCKNVDLPRAEPEPFSFGCRLKK